VSIQDLGEVVTIAVRKAEAWMPERVSRRMDASIAPLKQAR